MTLNINIFGAPHSGKSTFAAGLFAEMKAQGYDVEHLQETCKLNAYQAPNLLSKPYLTFFSNAHSMAQWQDYTEYLINESHPLTSAFYDSSILDLALCVYNRFKNLNLLLSPIPMSNKHSTKGRVHKTDEIINNVQTNIKKFLTENNIEFTQIDTPKDFSKVLQTLECINGTNYYEIGQKYSGASKISEIYLVPTLKEWYGDCDNYEYEISYRDKIKISGINLDELIDKDFIILLILETGTQIEIDPNNPV